MRIALIAPPYPLEEAPSPPLGTASIAAVCLQAGTEVIILDFIVTKYSPEKLQNLLNQFKPDIIGINSVTMNFKKAAEIISEAKKILPHALTIMGGPHVSFDPENTLHTYPHIDMIAMKEGESIISEIIDSLKNNASLENISGTAFRKDGTVIINDARPFITNLDSLPVPARHLLPLSKYRALGFPVSITTSRGCPNMCIFCLGRKMVGYKVRYRKINMVLDEIESLLDLGFNVINIADDTFTAKKERVLEFCHGIRDRNLVFSWSVFSRVNTIDEEMITAMKDAGCTALSFGIESGSRDILKKIKKGITVEQVYKADTICAEKGIRAHGSFIAGLPGETTESFGDTILMQNTLTMEYGCHILAPFPGTSVREEIENHDLEILTDDWDLYDANHAVIRTSSLTPDEILQLVETSHQEITDNWRQLNDRYLQKETSHDETLMVMASRRAKLIYAILSEDLIEENEKIEGKFKDAFTELTRRLSEHTGIENELTEIFISRLIEEGLLQHCEKDGKTFFSWSR